MRPWKARGLKRVADCSNGGVILGPHHHHAGLLWVILQSAGGLPAPPMRCDKKAAKFAVSGIVPVVGSILSDAAETVLAGAGLFEKNSVGVFGMLAVLSMCVIPFLQLGVHYLAYKLTAALSRHGGGGRVAGLIDNIGGAFGLVLGMTGACALLLLVSMISASLRHDGVWGGGGGFPLLPSPSPGGGSWWGGFFFSSSLCFVFGWSLPFFWFGGWFFFFSQKS